MSVAATARTISCLDRRISPADQLAELPVGEHVRHFIAECLRLSKLSGLEDLRLAAWAHMLGLRGHLSTKSRQYSTTFGALRAERAQHQRDHATIDSLWPTPEDNATLILAQWRFAGQGQPPITRRTQTPSDPAPAAGPAGGDQQRPSPTPMPWRWSWQAALRLTWRAGHWQRGYQTSMRPWRTRRRS